MSASLVGSEMCIRDRPRTVQALARPTRSANDVEPAWLARRCEARRLQRPPLKRGAPMFAGSDLERG
eukprot:2224306-Alexandrium_andersonii.AAC.1